MFSGLKRQVIDVMRATGLLEHVGQARIHATADQALAYIYAQADGAHDEDTLQPTPTF